jgi:hypothetical protein
VRLWVPGSTARRDRRIGAGDQAWPVAHRRGEDGSVAPVGVPAFAAAMVLGAHGPYAVLGQGTGSARSPRS